jgi:hypothetical protein
MIDVIQNISDITPAWLTDALKQNEIIESRVKNVEVAPMGAGVGLMAELCRLTIEYEGEEKAPRTMIAKCAAKNDNIQVARILDFYNRETNFYNKIGDDCSLTVPKSYFGKVNQETYDFILLLEDLGDVSPRDQIVGASSDEAFSAVGRLAEMHAKWWGKVSTSDSAWMYDFMSRDEAGRLQELVYMPGLEPTIEKFDSFFTQTTKDLCRTVGQRYPEFWNEKLTPVDTFIHGDYRQDNMIYQNESLDAVVMDWQICGKGKGIFDVAYFMCQSLKSDVRANIEKEVLELYVAKLKEFGVPGYGFDQCFRDYRIVVLGCLIYPITVCGSLDLANDRGRALAECMLERNLTAIEELGSQQFM